MNNTSGNFIYTKEDSLPQEQVNLSKPKHFAAFDYCRAFAAMSVVGIHVTSTPIGIMEKSSLLFQFFFILNRLITYSVPLFLIISAMLEAIQVRNKERINFKEFYIKKIKRVAVPYLVWSILYLFFYIFVMKYYPANTLLSLQLFDFLVLGKSAYHLYFLIILIQFYLVFPLVLKLRNIRSEYYIPVIVANYFLQIGFNYWIGKAIFPVFPSIVNTYFWYFFILNSAFLIGLIYPKPLLKNNGFRIGVTLLGLASGIYYVYISLQMELQRNVISTFHLPSWYLYTFIISFVFLAVFPKVIKEQSLSGRFLKEISRHSYGIYFIHPLILTLHTDFILSKMQAPDSKLYAIIIFVLYLWVLLFSYLVSKLLAKSKYFRWMLGQ